jgi:hypothetical protein
MALVVPGCVEHLGAVGIHHAPTTAQVATSRRSEFENYLASAKQYIEAEANESSLPGEVRQDAPLPDFDTPPPAPPEGVADIAFPVELLQLPPDAQPTPWDEIHWILRDLNPQPDEVFVDFGCGPDARILIAAVTGFGVKKAIGYEVEESFAVAARQTVARMGLSDRIEIRCEDSTLAEIEGDVGYAYLWPETLEKLAPKLDSFDRVASFAHDIPGVATVDKQDWFLYEPSQQTVSTGVPESRKRYYAVWQNRKYYAPRCNKANCTMDNEIRRQLAAKEQFDIIPETRVTTQQGSTGGRWVNQCYTKNGKRYCRQVWIE